MFEAAELVSKKNKAKSSSALVPAVSHTAVAVQSRLSVDAPSGDTQKREPE